MYKFIVCALIKYVFQTNSQIEIEREKLQLEKDKLADKAAERDHELLKLNMQQEFEMKKLQLQLGMSKQN